MNNAVVAFLRANLQSDTALTDGLSKALSQMEADLKASCKSKNKNLEADLMRVVSGGGKRLRPVLVYLGCQAGKEETKTAAGPDRTPEGKEYPIVPLMTAVELVHTSSLIHDDIVDRADVRRSVPTINKTSGDYAAVQAGDFLLSKASLILKHYQGLKLDKRFGAVASAMCLAEFLQIETANTYNAESRSRYFEQIENKTANFISAAVAMGAKAGGADALTEERLAKYGRNVGIAFQLRDDVLDFASDEGFGKKLGKDLERGLFTLPLLLSLQEVPQTQQGQKQLARAKATAVAKGKSEEDIAFLLQFVKTSGALKEAQELIGHYTQKAIETIKPLGDSEAKEALILLAGSLAVRNL